MKRITLLVSASFAICSCVSKNTIQPEGITSAIQDVKYQLAAEYFPDFLPLQQPIAIVHGNEIYYISGPCEGVSVTQCKSAITPPSLKPGQFLVRNQKKDNYSYYGLNDAARTASLIAHEEFHWWQHETKITPTEPKNVNNTNQSTPAILSSKQLYVLLLEIDHLAKTMINNETDDKRCLAGAIVDRITEFPMKWNQLLETQQMDEGLAKYVGLMYQFSGQRGEVVEFLLREMSFDGYTDLGDGHAMLNALSYSMGALKTVLITDIYGMISPSIKVDDKLIETYGRPKPDECADADSRARFERLSHLLNSELITAQQQIIDILAEKNTAYVYRLTESATFAAFSRRLRIGSGNLLLDDVTIILDSGETLLDTMQEVLLPGCGSEIRTIITFHPLAGRSPVEQHGVEIRSFDDISELMDRACKIDSVQHTP